MEVEQIMVTDLPYRNIEPYLKILNHTKLMYGNGRVTLKTEITKRMFQITYHTIPLHTYNFISMHLNYI